MMMWTFQNLHALLVLHIFEFVLTGMLFTIITYHQWTSSRQLFSWMNFGLILIALASLALSVNAYHSIVDSDIHFYAHLYRFLFYLQGAGVLCLFLSRMKSLNLPARITLFGLLTVLALMTFSGSLSFYLYDASQFIIFLTLLIYGFRKTPSGIFLLAQCTFLLWTASSIAVQITEMNNVTPAIDGIFLFGLLLIALWQERPIKVWMERLFIRLNLIFMILAATLMVLISSFFRNHMLQMHLDRARTPAEFVRGYILYYHQQGVKPDEYVQIPDLTEAIVTLFSQIPDLMETRFIIQAHELSFRQADDGTIEFHDSIRENSWANPHLSAPAKGDVQFIGNEILYIWPVNVGPENLGRILFIQNPRWLNKMVGQQYLLIFSSFTVAVIFSGFLIGVILINTERRIQQQVEEIKRKEEELIYASRLAFLGELAGHLAHEINNPAGIITTRAGLLQMAITEKGTGVSASDLNDWLQDLQVIQDQAMRIGRFSHELLELARPRPLQKQWVNLKAMVEHVWSLIYDPTSHAHVTSQFNIPDNLQIYGDPVRLEQVFTNLFKNALDAMPRGGLFQVDVTEHNDHIMIRVKDTGIGISKDIVDQIWEPFFTTKHQGTGLGLSTVRRIIKAHQGTITVSSPPDRGTEFTIMLPLHSPDKPRL